MKVALTFPGCHRRGGVERVIFECARFLAARGHEVTVITSFWDEVPAPGVEMIRVSLPKSPAFLSGWRFQQASSAVLRGIPHDVHGAHGCVCPFGGVYWAHSVHKAWIEAARRYRPWTAVTRWKQWLNPIHRVLLNLERRHLALRRYRKVIAMCPRVGEDLNRLYGVPWEAIEIVPNGYAPDEFTLAAARDSRERIRREFGYGPGDRVVVFVANEVERKGLKPLIAAAGRLRDLSVQLLVVGDIPPRPLAGWIAQHGLTGRVRFAGPASNVAPFYGAGDVMALPTQYEAWGLVIVEALACGLPVLTSKLAGASSAIREGWNGALLDDPSDSREIEGRLRALLSGKLGAASEISASVAHLKWESTLERYAQILESAG